MAKAGEDWRPDFEQALGETFGEYVSPPVPCDGSRDPPTPLTPSARRAIT